jgi:hypothetical protein
MHTMCIVFDRRTLPQGEPVERADRTALTVKQTSATTETHEVTIAITSSPTKT